MKNILITSIFFLCGLAASIGLSAQEDVPYYNQPKKRKSTSPFSYQIYTDISRSFYRDINLNFEKSIFGESTLTIGLGYFRPRTYKFWNVLEFENFDVVAKTSGWRAILKYKEYIIDNMKSFNGGVTYAYNSLPGFAYNEFIPSFSWIIPIFKNFTVTPEIGFKLIVYMHKRNSIQAERDFDGGFFGNISVGYRHKKKQNQ